MAALTGLALMLGAYLLGAVPWGMVLGRLFGGVDLRAHGSGATGATNALRVLGWRISLGVFALDFAKGLLPVLLGRVLGINEWFVAAAAVASVVGHCWSPWIRFTGGKGVATGSGAATGLWPWIPILFFLMAAIVAVTRFVSLASLTAAAIACGASLLAAAFGWTSWPAAVGITVMAIIIVTKHRANIRRLLDGTENRFGERTATSTSVPPAS